MIALLIAFVWHCPSNGPMESFGDDAHGFPVAQASRSSSEAISSTVLRHYERRAFGATVRTNTKRLILRKISTRVTLYVA